MGRKILLADDSITIQKVVNLTFSDEGIDVVTVGNGELAVRKMNDVRPDIVLADIYMPGKNGYEVCEFIKTNPQFAHVPVLLLVGAFEPFDQAEAIRVKADGHLTKPFESRALVATVTRLLAQAPPSQVASPVQPVAPPPVTAQPSNSWQMPPDSTTTRLSSDMAARFQASYASEPAKTDISPKVEPIKASPVPMEDYQPPMASPVPMESYQPPKASPVPMESYQPPMASPVPSNNPPSANFGEATISYNQGFNPPMAKPSISETGFEMSFTNEHSSPFAQPAPPPEKPAPSFNNSFQFDFNAPVAEPAPEPISEPVPEQMEELDLPDEMEQTQIMGSTMPRSANFVSNAYNPPPIDISSPLELDEVEITNQPSGPHIAYNQNANAYQSDSLAENQYEDITPLDLEPLEEIGYQSNQPEAVLELSSEPLPIEELPAIDTEDILETTGSFNNEQRDEAQVQQTAYEQQYNLEEQPVFEESNSYEEQTPVYQSQPVEPSVVNNAPTFDMPTFTPQDQIRTTNSIEMNRTTGSMYESVPVESTEPNYEMDMMPAELRAKFQAELQPAVPPAAEGYQESIVEPPAPVFELQPEEESAPLPRRPLQSELPTLPQLEALPVAMPLPPPSFAVTQPEVVEPYSYQPVETYSEVAEVTEAVHTTPVIEPPPVTVVPTPMPVQPLAMAPTEEAETTPVISSVPVQTVAPVSTQPVAITSIDQIPQHLIDEIVRRTIAQMSENVVREIAWEVVPDLAELLIKKRLEQNR